MIDLVVFSFLIFPFPLAIYCLVLALINGSRRPMLVPGSWDCIGLLFGLSGFLLATLPVLLTRFFDRILSMYPGIDVATATTAALDRLLPADCMRGGTCCSRHAGTRR